MPTITVRNVPPGVVASLKALARRHNRSMEQEVRELLEGYVAEREAILDRIEAGWQAQPRRLGIASIATGTLCQGALLRSIESGVAVYDTLFVELAARSGCPLATFDAAVLRAFPDIARRPRDLQGP